MNVFLLCLDVKRFFRRKLASLVACAVIVAVAGAIAILSVVNLEYKNDCYEESGAALILLVRGDCGAVRYASSGLVTAAVSFAVIFVCSLSALSLPLCFVPIAVTAYSRSYSLALVAAHDGLGATAAIITACVATLVRIAILWLCAAASAECGVRLCDGRYGTRRLLRRIIPCFVTLVVALTVEILLLSAVVAITP